MTEGSIRPLGAGITAAAAFACADVLAKVVFLAGGDVVTLLSFRGVVGIAFLAIWLRLGAPLGAFSSRERWIATGLGLLFAITVFGVLKAIELMDAPTAILAYFIYPLLTGIIAAITGLERLGWQGVAAALVAFGGLALMIGAHPGEVALVGVLMSFGGAASRAAMLLLTRAFLAKADARLTTWYSLVSSTAVFVSANRIGPFRTALIMNLEPLLVAIAGALFLGDVFAPLQALGGAVMLAALVAFQVRR